MALAGELSARNTNVTCIYPANANSTSRPVVQEGSDLLQGLLVAGIPAEMDEEESQSSATDKGQQSPAAKRPGPENLDTGPAAKRAKSSHDGLVEDAGARPPVVARRVPFPDKVY